MLYWYLKSGVFRVPGFEYVVVTHFRVEEVGKD